MYGIICHTWTPLDPNDPGYQKTLLKRSQAFYLSFLIYIYISYIIIYINIYIYNLKDHTLLTIVKIPFRYKRGESYREI